MTRHEKPVFRVRDVENEFFLDSVGEMYEESNAANCVSIEPKLIETRCRNFQNAF